MKFLITGVTGLIGQELCLRLLKEGHEVYGITRQKNFALLPKKNVINLDLESEFPSDIVKGYDVIIHLAGYPVADEYWSTSVKEKIKSSRVLATKNLVNALNRLDAQDKPKFFVAGSAIGIYGKGFLADVTRDWEAQSLSVENVPTAVVRTGIVLSRNGGALVSIPPVVVGDGSMVMSWIHIDDWISACCFVIERRITGCLNFTAPQPASQRHFVKTLVKSKKYPFSLWTPLLMPKIFLGERANVLFESLDIRPQELVGFGYEFKFLDIEQALSDIYKNEKMTDQVLFVSQYINKNKNEVFKFFSEAKNLEKLTPEFLNFKIVNMSTIDVQEGTLIEYKLKIHGIPITWKTLISEWKPEFQFVDEQLKGPYQKWHHTHSFIEVKDGTIITDRVVYRLPLSVFGLIGLPLVKRDVKNIFEYRKKVILDVFN